MSILFDIDKMLRGNFIANPGDTYYCLPNLPHLKPSSSGCIKVPEDSLKYCSILRNGTDFATYHYCPQHSVIITWVDRLDG